MSVDERQGNNRLHFPHVKSMVDLEKHVTPVFKGLYRFKRSEQAVTAGTLRHVIHELQPTVTPASNLFNKVNQFVDVDLPQNLHYLDQTDVHLILTRESPGDTTEPVHFTSVPSNLFSHIEVREGSEVKETITDLDQWMDKVIYKEPWEQDRHATSTHFNPATHAVSAVPIIAVGAVDSNIIRIPISTYLTKCGIPPTACKNTLTLRFYTQHKDNVLSNDVPGAAAAPANVALKEFKLKVREVRGRDDALRAATSPHVDWRFLGSKHEEKILSLTSGSTYTWILNNFSEDDLCSHMWVFVRTPGLNGDDRDDMLSGVIDRIWLENESGQNILNGNQYNGSELLHIQYADKFRNTANQAHGVYLLFSPAVDPESDYNDGVMTGAQSLLHNMKLKIVAASTGNYQFDVVAMCHHHCRIQDGRQIIQ